MVHHETVDRQVGDANRFDRVRSGAPFHPLDPKLPLSCSLHNRRKRTAGGV